MNKASFTFCVCQGVYCPVDLSVPEDLAKILYLSPGPCLHDPDNLKQYNTHHRSKLCQLESNTVISMSAEEVSN